MKRSVKLALISASSVVVLLATVLALHIYTVNRHTAAPDATTISMARMDFKQDISQSDVDKITTWLYNQEGIDHVLCNSQSGIVVFTFYPVKTNANTIISNFKTVFDYKADRYLPSATELQSGCPVKVTSASESKNFFKHIF